MLPPSRLLLGLLIAATGLAVGCSALDPVTDSPEVVGPGGRALDSDDPSCSADSDCATGEQCIGGLCQMQRCGTQEYKSVAPLGSRSYLAADRELLVVSDETRKVDGYEPTRGSFAHPAGMTFDLGGKTILDVAGGNLSGSRPESVAAVAEASTSLYVTTGAQRRELALGFQPVAVAAGDVDGDAIDEAVVLGRDGDLSVCRITESRCDRSSLAGMKGKDIVVADVDGDGNSEPVVLADGPDGKSSLLVVNVDHKTTNQPEIVRLATGRTLARVTALRTEPNAPPTIVVLEDGGYGDLVGDTLRFYGLRDGKLTELGNQAIAKDAVDVFAGDLDGDDKADLLVLEKSGVEVFDASGPASVASVYKTVLSSSTKASRLALADLDGDSPAGTLVGKAELVPGPVVPVAMLVYPPYSRTYSDGTAQVGIGNKESKGEASETTVSLRASVALGFEAEFPGIAKAMVMGKVEGRLERGRENGRTVSVSDRFSIDARPDLEGPDNGVAMLACACYHAYTYRIEDPKRKLAQTAADGRLMSFFVPVGGQTSLWSLKRYNALAARVGNLPNVRVPYVVGDPSSYPQKMMRLDGSPIPSDDLLFSTPRAYRVSDVARVGWQMDVVETEANRTRRSVAVSVRGQIKAGSVIVEGEVGAGLEETYKITVGKEASFGGSVPPVRNDVRTPEDEHSQHAYGFSPLVYREHYRTKDGNDGGYFVVSYSVTP